MGVKLTKDSIDLGIVVSDPERSLAFYRDTLASRMTARRRSAAGRRCTGCMCGTSTIKLVHHPKELPAAEPGGINRALGYRYWTISVDNIQEVVDACNAAGFKIAVPVTELRPGVTIAMIEDPDGNWVELLSRG